MSAVADPVAHRAAVNIKLTGLIASGSVALAILLSGFVLHEPAPYDIYMVALVGIWALFGLKLSRAAAPMTGLLVLFNIGGLIAMTQMAELADTPLYLAVSVFLAFTAIFYASVAETRPGLLPVIFNAYVVAAVATSLMGIAGYFNLFPGAEVFTRYGRASGVFQDPNVFGPFLVLPAIWLLHGLMTGSPARMMLAALPLSVIACGIFLSFSRGAWGLFAVSVVLMVGLLFLQSDSGRFRLKIVVMTVAAVTLLIALALITLQIPGVADMLSERARLAQDYDSARLGRFARYGIGFMVALEHPPGIGPLVFGKIYGEDTHNIWLKALLDYGWLGFSAYLTLTIWTLAAGFRLILRNRPWQPYLLCAYVVYLGHVGLGTFIDTDHWRHFYLLLGIIWAIIALETRYQNQPSQGDLDHGELRL
ncbi:O-antigen ligase [Aquamicrobium lusatiense]|uniref:O-antigen ligase n=1 Tax=Aquamicrobium lusatiense TaxID=89772 RepID=A0A7W9VWJ0_9HYPH|nr:O-antigen ligase family protein [Aquamicrobium lusatiense]MBB6013172.1 O-antigen ligase [Aquamicrobium lusatiense]